MLNILVNAPEIEHTAVWLRTDKKPVVIVDWEALCEHVNTESIELASGLSHSFTPETVAGTHCMDCGEVWHD